MMSTPFSVHFGLRLPWVQALFASLLTAFVASSVDAATVNAASCSRADVAAAISTASYGDTVVVPAGSCTWSSSLTITKGITLQGAGAGATTIRSAAGSNSYLLVYNPDSNSISSDRAFKLTGFTFDMNNASGGVHVMSNSPNMAMTKLQIYSNVFTNTGGNGTSTDLACIQIGEPGQIYGVIYSNAFTNCKTTTENYGGYENSWNNFTFTFGGADNLYYEDNTFSGNSAFFYGGHGGRYVARFNTISFNSSTYEVVWDVHGNQPGGVYATMGCEIYRNAITSNHGTAILDHRGGKCMVWDNTITGSGDWQVREEYDDSIDPEANPQPQHVSDTYYFLNKQNGNNVVVSERSDCCGAIAPNAQYLELHGVLYRRERCRSWPAREPAVHVYDWRWILGDRPRVVDY